MTQAAMQTYPQVREERGVAVPSHEVAGDGAGAASWSRTTRTAPDARDTSTVRLAGCAGARSITDLVVSAGARLAFTGTGFAGEAARVALCASLSAANLDISIRTCITRA